jgi:hypothetical protein
MNCPFCKRRIEAVTGFQEAVKFQRHMRTCNKNPSNLPLSDGRQTVISPSNPSLTDALEVRAASGQ